MAGKNKKRNQNQKSGKATDRNPLTLDAATVQLKQSDETSFARAIQRLFDSFPPFKKKNKERVNQERLSILTKAIEANLPEGKTVNKWTFFMILDEGTGPLHLFHYSLNDLCCLDNWTLLKELLFLFHAKLNLIPKGLDKNRPDQRSVETLQATAMVSILSRVKKLEVFKFHSPSTAPVDKTVGKVSMNTFCLNAYTWLVKPKSWPKVKEAVLNRLTTDDERKGVDPVQVDLHSTTMQEMGGINALSSCWSSSDKIFLRTLADYWNDWRVVVFTQPTGRMCSAGCKKEVHYHCTNCKRAYCSPKCQLAHWSDHKTYCNSIARLIAPKHLVPIRHRESVVEFMKKIPRLRQSEWWIRLLRSAKKNVNWEDTYEMLSELIEAVRSNVGIFQTKTARRLVTCQSILHLQLPGIEYSSKDAFVFPGIEKFVLATHGILFQPAHLEELLWDCVVANFKDPIDRYLHTIIALTFAIMLTKQIGWPVEWYNDGKRCTITACINSSNLPTTVRFSVSTECPRKQVKLIFPEEDQHTVTSFLQERGVQTVVQGEESRPRPFWEPYFQGQRFAAIVENYFPENEKLTSIVLGKLQE